VTPPKIIDDEAMFISLQGVRIRASATKRLGYDLSVVAADVADVVNSAGGWLCDRVRAGWRVSVFLPGEFDARPLQILGVRALSLDTDFDYARTPAALAVAAQHCSDNERLRGTVIRILTEGSSELTVWGGDLPDIAGEAGRTRHRLSSAAVAFKTQAALAAGLRRASAGTVEHFHSCAMWYPPDGPDLIAANSPRDGRYAIATAPQTSSAAVSYQSAGAS
jgi:hypothetical protein